MPLKTLESFPAGGVDSRSNPITMGQGQYLSVHDLWPQADGSFRLRDGYSLAVGTLTAVVGAAAVQVNVPGVTLPTGNYFFILVKEKADGSQPALSAELGPIAISSTKAAQIQTIPQDADAAFWRVYFGTTSGAESQYVRVSRADVAAQNFSITIGAPGTAGPLPVSLPALPIHSIVDFRGPGPSYKPLWVFWQGTTPYVCDPATSVVNALTVRGVAITSGSKFCYFYTGNHLHAFNGATSKWLNPDDMTWRDVGLPRLTDAELATIGFTEGCPELTASQLTTASPSFAATGTFPADAVGRFVYVVIADSKYGACELGPATIAIGNGTRIKAAASQKLSITSLPDLASLGYTSNFSKLIAITDDSGIFAYFLTDTNTPVSSFTYDTQQGRFFITSPSHGLATADMVIMPGALSRPEWTVFSVILVDSDHFAVEAFGGNPSNYGGLASGFNPTVVKRIARATGSATSINVTAPTVDKSYVVNRDRGIPASSIGGAQPGIKLHAALYNRTVGGHVGNHRQITNVKPHLVAPATISQDGRMKLTGRKNVIVYLEAYSTSNVGFVQSSPVPVFGGDSEWELLIGRTSDGAELPHAIIESDATWVTSKVTAHPFAPGLLIITQPNIDGDAELPTRNYPPPGTLDFNTQIAPDPPFPSTFAHAWVEDEKCCGTIEGTPTIYRSGSAQDARSGKFVGLPEQSWHPFDIETFPTAQPITCGQAYEKMSWVYTREDCGVLLELAGELQWQGPWNFGCVGQFAWARGWRKLPYWLTPERQLVTIVGSGESAEPQPISGEYEAALLGKIGAAYLSQVEFSYIRHPHKLVDVLRMRCRDSAGNSFTVIHDFNLRDQSHPFGRGYEERFLGPLGADFTQAYMRDGNDIGQVIAGASDGKLYTLYSGTTDAGTEFTGESLNLSYFGAMRPAFKHLSWYGDRQAKWFIAHKMNTPFDVNKMIPLCGAAPPEVQGQDGDSHWIVDVNDEFVHAYLLLRLTSHSLDGDMELNDPPHMPLEDYGRVWVVEPELGGGRPR